MTTTHDRRFDRVMVVLVGALAVVFVALSAIPGHAAGFSLNHWAQNSETSTMTVDHSKWAQILDSYLVVGDGGLNRFRYGSVSDADRQVLKSYLTDLQAVKVTALNRDEQFAYWINLYNALTIDVVLDHYPVKSIRNISLSGFFSIGPWKAQLVTVDGQDLSLDDIEHGILRGLWKDPRIHYGVNCASVGCPNLQPVPFTGKTVDDQLTDAAIEYINDPRGVRIDTNRVRVSSIYSWFKVDFGNNDQGVLAHLATYADESLKAELSKFSRINGYDYDWSLNDARKQ